MHLWARPLEMSASYYWLVITEYWLIIDFSDFDQPPSDSPSDSSDSGSQSEDSDAYNDILGSITKKWLLIQLTHNVSAAATNSFWDAAFDSIPMLNAAKGRWQSDKDVPGFINLRRKLYTKICPQVHMKFVYLKKSTNSIETVHCTKDPGKRYPKSQFMKLFEEAHIKVLKVMNNYVINILCSYDEWITYDALKTDLLCTHSKNPLKMIA